MKIDYEDMLTRLILTHGQLSTTYKAFHAYSLNNRLLALQQLTSRGLGIAPIATMHEWNKRGRKVKYKEKGIGLYSPKKYTRRDDAGEAISENTYFTIANRWFTYHQTEGNEEAIIVEPTFDMEKCLATLKIKETVWTSLDAVAMAITREDSFSLNPLNPFPDKARFHSIAHIVLDHPKNIVEERVIANNIAEVEAELVAFICCESLELPGGPQAKAFIEYYLDVEKIPGDSIRRAFLCADKILKTKTDLST